MFAGSLTSCINVNLITLYSCWPNFTPNDSHVFLFNLKNIINFSSFEITNRIQFNRIIRKQTSLGYFQQTFKPVLS